MSPVGRDYAALAGENSQMLSKVPECSLVKKPLRLPFVPTHMGRRWARKFRSERSKQVIYYRWLRAVARNARVDGSQESSL
jgi:hypothetical protein